MASTTRSGKATDLDSRSSLQPPPARQSPRVSDRTVLVVASFGAFLAFLDATIVNVAFPSIRASFPESSISALSWVLNSYNIVFAAFLIPAGRLADLVGRRRAFAWGVGVFTVASVVCALAPSVEFLVAARAVQAFGAALLVPASLALVVEANTPERRTHAVGLWGASAAVAAGLGPPIGGALVEIGNWRWAFLVNLPIGAAALIAARRTLVESRAPGRRRLPDLRGASMFALGLAVLTLAIVEGNDWGWASVGVIGSLAAAAVLFAGFVWSSRRHRSPLLDPALLRIRPFVVANLVTLVGGIGFYAYLLTNILWLEYVWGYSVLTAGLALVPAAVVAAIVAAALGPRAASSGYRRFIVPGAIIWCLAYLWYVTQVGVTPAFVTQWLPGQVLSGIGVGATLPLLGSAGLAAVPGGRYATASAVVSSARQIGGVLGIAVLVALIGTPTPGTAADDLRRGWILAAGCFALCAIGALLLSGWRTEPDDVGDADEPVTSIRFPQPVPQPDSASGTGDPWSAVPLFDRLPEASRATLVHSAVEVHVGAGEWLMREGDAADGVYVVRTGRLEVLVADVVVRELGPGAVIGELALLTGATRSASVRARRDSTLVEVTRQAFESATTGDAQALSAITVNLAEQLQSQRAPASERSTAPSVVTVVGVSLGVDVDAVAASLADVIRRDVDVALPGRPSADGLSRAERDHARVLLTADLGDTTWAASAVRQADLVVVVADSTADPTTLRLPNRPGCDLVLVGPRPSQDRVRDWSNLLSPWAITYVDPGAMAAGLRPLAARIAGTSLGLVMAGGGARAFAHIGVLLELESAGLVVDRVAGASVGAIIAAAHATGRDGQDLHDVCYAEFVRRSPFSDYTVPSVSLAKGRRCIAGLRRAFGDVLIEELPRRFLTSSTDLVKRETYVHRSGDLVGAVMSSVSLPVLFPPRVQQDRVLVDGGVLDNLPVRLLTERPEGPVLAVNIAMGSGSGAPSSGPRRARVPALGETLLRTMMIGSAGAVDAAVARGATVITPPTLGVGLLEFHQLDRMVDAGRLAARRLLEETGGRIPTSSA